MSAVHCRLQVHRIFIVFNRSVIFPSSSPHVALPTPIIFCVTDPIIIFCNFLAVLPHCCHNIFTGVSRSDRTFYKRHHHCSGFHPNHPLSQHLDRTSDNRVILGCFYRLWRHLIHSVTRTSYSEPNSRPRYGALKKGGSIAPLIEQRC